MPYLEDYYKKKSLQQSVNLCDCGGYYEVTSYDGKAYVLYCNKCLWALESNLDKSWGYRDKPIEDSYWALNKHRLGNGYYIEEIGLVR